MVNPYNEHLLRAWRANMDVQVVGCCLVCDTLHLQRQIASTQAGDC